MKVKISLNENINQNYDKDDFEKYLQACEDKGYKVVRKHNKECSLQELCEAFEEKRGE